jgi:hypothetical protein
MEICRLLRVSKKKYGYSVGIGNGMRDQGQRFSVTMDPETIQLHARQLASVTTSLGDEQFYRAGEDGVLMLVWISERYDGAAWHRFGP